VSSRSIGQSMANLRAMAALLRGHSQRELQSERSEDC
jgi:hypothetical protein